MDSKLWDERIEQKALEYAGFKPGTIIDEDERYYNTQMCNVYDAYKAGAKSEEAKEFWRYNIGILNGL